MNYDYKPINSETPWDFRKTVNIQNLKIEYKQMIEVCQGGPCVGNLYINDVEIQSGKMFGGPFLMSGECLYIPLFVRKFSTTGFQLFCWNLTKQTFLIGTQILPLIRLDRIDGDEIHYSIGNKMSDKKITLISEFLNYTPSLQRKDHSSQNWIIFILLLNLM